MQAVPAPVAPSRASGYPPAPVHGGYAPAPHPPYIPPPGSAAYYPPQQQPQAHHAGEGAMCATILVYWYVLVHVVVMKAFPIRITTAWRLSQGKLSIG